MTSEREFTRERTAEHAADRQRQRFFGATTAPDRDA